MNGRTFRDALKDASFILEQIENPYREALLLLSNTIDQDISRIYYGFDKQLDEHNYDRYIAACRERAAGKPFQYIVGKAEFYSLELLVTPDVLIPRSDTELLVDIGLDFLKSYNSQEPLRVLDLCTGSGCVAIAIASNFKNCEIVASDISQRALEIAGKNILKYKLGNRITLVESDLFENIQGNFDLILSNPPYIPKNQIPTLQREVQDYEPELALCGGQDGLDFYRLLASQAPSRLRTGGGIGMEIGLDQGDAVLEVFNIKNAYNVRENFKNHEKLKVSECCISKDLNGIERVIYLTKDCIQ